MGREADMTRWTVEVTEDGRELRFLFDGKMEQLANIGQTVWIGGEYEKTKRYRQAAKECVATLVRDHHRAEETQAELDTMTAKYTGAVMAVDNLMGEKAARAEAFEAMRGLIDALELRLIDMQGRIDNCEEDTLSYLSSHIQAGLAEIQGIRPSKQLKEPVT